MTAAFGTPGFMAPEQAEFGIISVSTDIYGLGITFCHLFRPNLPAPEIVKQDKDLPSSLRELIAEMTAADPTKRPENMREVAASLDLQAKKGRNQKWFRQPLRWFKKK
jgi:serine/threonine protein kinase